jgi:hypothetical protein
VRARWLGFVVGFAAWALAAGSLGAQAAHGGFTIAVETRTAAHAVRGAPTAVVHAPAGFDPRAPLHVVVFLHGHNGCAQVLMAGGEARCRPGDAAREGWDLAARHDAAGTNTLFVIPQLAFLQRSGDPGCFARAGCFRRFLDELLGDALASQLGGPRALRELGSLTLVAHSGGFQAALAILEHGAVSERVRAVVLFDALYAHADRFFAWLRGSARKDARLVSVYLGNGSTRRESRALLARARRALGAGQVATAGGGTLASELPRRRVLIAPTRAAHRAVPEHHLAEVLAALPYLPKR